MDTQQTSENSKNNIPEQNIQALEINAQMVNRLAAIEQQKISLEAQRLELAKQQDLNGYNYSLKALELKRDSHKNEQELTEKFLNKMFWFAMYFSTIAIGLVIASFHYGKEQFIYECLKVLVPLIIGWIGGDAWRRQKNNDKKQEPPTLQQP